jgi:NAD(P)H-flavin reductase
LIICQAARAEVEKEELLELHRTVAENTLKLKNGLQDAIRNAAAESAQHRAFIQATESMQRDLLREIEEVGVTSRNIFSNLINEIETAISSTIMRVISSMGSLEKDTAILQEVSLENIHHNFVI